MQTEFNRVLSIFNIPKTELDKTFQTIVSCYSESQRHYHNLRHIREMLECLNSHRDAISDYPSLYISCLYHDIVYDTHSADNEEKSAEYLERDFKEYFPKEKIEICKNLILGTKTHQFLKDDFDNKIFLDSDLLILGRERNRYIEYMDSIRKEYEWVERELFKQERTKVLQKFLERERIYFTNEIFENYEIQARENIKFEIEMYFQK